MNALSVMVREESDRRFTAEYTAEHIWILTGLVYKYLTDNKIPTKEFVELMYPEVGNKDERTAEEIKQDILKRLTQ